MTGRQHALAGLVISAVALGALMAQGDLTAQTSEPAPNADCTVNAAENRTPVERWRRVSRQAEAIAPSGLPVVSDAASVSRRRAVTPSAPSFPAKNFIDSEIFGKMQKDGIRWTVPASDEEFLRRVSLDLTGQIPTAQRAKDFLADTSAGKRDKLIDELLASEEFVERWTLWFGDHLQNVRASANIVLYDQGRNAYYNWMKDSFRSGKPYDLMVRELITGKGGPFTVGPANYWVRQIQTNGPIQDTFDNLSAESAEKFLGLPLTCISCHNGLGHLEQVNTGLVRRTRNEFWKNAAFFARDYHRPQRDQERNTVEFFVEPNPVVARAEYLLNTNSGNKTARQPSATQTSPVQPVFFLSGETPAPGEPRRDAYARILTAQPQFARATANYIWKEIFGLGIVEPADSFDLLRQDQASLAPGATLQPTHPELLTRLGDHFVVNRYDFRAFLKTIVSSNTYQLSSVYTPGGWNESWTPYYARHYPRRMLAESVVDSIARATGVAPPRMTVNGLTIDRAMQLPDPTEPRSTVTSFLNSFGRGDRDTTPRTRDGSIVQALSMINDAFVTSRVKSAGNSTVQRVLIATRDPLIITDELYIATLSRKPTAAERGAAAAHLSQGDLTRQTEDLHFALLNRLEFLYY